MKKQNEKIVLHYLLWKGDWNFRQKAIIKEHCEYYGITIDEFMAMLREYIAGLKAELQGFESNRRPKNKRNLRGDNEEK